MLVKQNLIGVFKKKCKNMSTEQEMVSNAAFKAWPYSSDFNFVCKDGPVTVARCKYYCPLVVNLIPLPIAAKNSILNVTELRLWERHHARKLVQFVWKPVFFLIISNCCHLYWKSLCFSLLYFTVWWSVFHQPFRQLLPLSCFYGSSQWFLKVKITCKRVNSIKK